MPVVRFISFCPLSESCAKGHSRLGADVDEYGARWRVSNHLQNSSYHMLGKQEAEDLAATCDVLEEENEDEPPADDSKVDKGDKGKGKQKSSRAEPYDGSGKGGKDSKDRKQGKRWNNDAGWSWSGDHDWYSDRPQQTLQIVTTSTASSSNDSRLAQALSRSEAAMRNAARLARAAATAFEEEAAIVQNELFKMTSAPDTSRI